MRLKTCWLNKSVLWSDFKRFWYLGILNMLATFFFGVFPASNTITSLFDIVLHFIEQRIITNNSLCILTATGYF